MNLRDMKHRANERNNFIIGGNKPEEKCESEQKNRNIEKLKTM